MAGLGLQNAVQGYMRGKQFADQQQELAYQQQQRAKADAEAQQRKAVIDAARQKAMGVYDTSKGKWAMAGAQGEWAPSEETHFKAAEAFSTELAKNGLIDEFIQNQAKLAPLRASARVKALQRYQADGDPAKLAMAIGPTLFDGKDVVGVERDEGADAVQGLSARPPKVHIKLSDGSTESMEVPKLVAAVKMMTQDPVAYAKQEAQLDYQRALANIVVDREGRIAKERQGEVRETKKAEYGLRSDLEGMKLGKRQEIQRERDAAADARSEGRNQAMLGVAGLNQRAGGGSGGKPPRGEDGMTTPERARLLKDNVDAAARTVETLNKRLSKDVRGDERRRLLADIDDATARLKKARDALESVATPAPAASSAGLSDANKVSPALQAERDAEAGKTLIGEVGGLAKAKELMAESKRRIASARNPDERQIFESEVRRLEAGIRAVEGAPGGGLATASPAVKPGKPEAKPTPDPKKIDMAAAQRVRADFRAGKLTRDQAQKKLRELGFN